MAYRKTAAIAAVTTAATTVLGTVSLGAPFGRVCGMFARNYASSAKAALGVDTAERVKLTDAAGIIFYLDAADKDYATAATGTLVKLITLDDTGSGAAGATGVIAVDSTGAAAAAGEASGQWIAQSPVTVEVQNAGTATDYFEVSLLVEI